jgi:hypothetical protein
LEKKAVLRWVFVKKNWIFHPFLFTLFPIASMLAENVGQVFAVDVLRITVIAVFTVLISLVVLKRIVGSWEVAALICSAGVLLFFSYGHVHLLMKNWTIGSVLIGRHRYLYPLWLIFMIGWTWFILKKVRRPTTWSKFLNVVSAGTLLLPTISLISYVLQTNSFLRTIEIQYTEVDQAHVPSGTEPPDIYYIIVDGYAREDVLMELYDYDNSEFINFLENEGFYVAEKSRSNYNQTDLSLSSSLNMTYLDFIPETRGTDERNRTPLAQLIKENQVIDFLRLQGYEVITFNSGYGPTVVNSADIFWDSATDDDFVLRENWTGFFLNTFENLLLRSSAAILPMDTLKIGIEVGVIPPEDPLYTSHRHRILYNLSKLKEVPAMDGVYFVYAHIIAPHPPFVFGSKGQWVTPPGIYTLATEGKFFTGPPEEYIEGYRSQLIYLNSVLTETLNAILQESTSPPMIVLQADHGPGAYLDQDSNENSNLKERISILNGYYFPNQDVSGLYPTISPVNTFRIVFNRIFNTDFELLNDKSYFSTVGQPFNFFLVPEEID